MTINMEDILKNATELSAQQPQKPQLPPVEETMEDPEVGLGLVVEAPKEEEQQRIGLTRAALDRVSQYTKDLDMVIAQCEDNMPMEVREKVELLEQAKQEGILPEDYVPKFIPDNQAKKEAVENKKEVVESEEDEDENDGNDKYDEVKIIIDKTGLKLGEILFSEEERAKIEKSKVIKLEEVENVNLEVKRTKKVLSDKKLGKILKKTVVPYTTQIVLPISGYTAEVAACSTYELLSLVLADQADEDPVIAQEKKWSVIHSKLVNTSLGKMSFDTFMRHTSIMDYRFFIFGILTATYGAQNKSIPFNCDHCKTEFEADLVTSSLLRIERLTDKMVGLIAGAVENSHAKDTADKWHKEAPVMTKKIIRLPSSQYIIELQLQSAHDNIHKSIEAINELADKDKIKAQLAIVASNVSRILIPDEDEPDVPYEVTSTDDIIEVLYHLDDYDIKVVTDQSSKLLEGLNVEFGMKDLECPNCNHVSPYVPLEIESLLFFQTQAALNTKVE